MQKHHSSAPVHARQRSLCGSHQHPLPDACLVPGTVTWVVPVTCPAARADPDSHQKLGDRLRLQLTSIAQQRTSNGSDALASAVECQSVVVWIHGGGFFRGNIAKPLWQGEFLVNQSVERGKPVIMVSVDYRLGALGFLASREWNVSGNFGIMDQQLALHWVQQHIADFGGDPSRVTVHGQSAGAMSAYIHLVSPASAGLFQKAHIRSNVGVHYRNYTEAQKHADTLAKSLLCLESKTRMRCLREKSFQQIIKSQLTFEYIVFFTEPGFGINFLQWLPVVDEGTELIVGALRQSPQCCAVTRAWLTQGKFYLGTLC